MLSLPTKAVADDGLYLAAGVGYNKIDTDFGLGIDDDSFHYQARVGYMVNKYWGFEGSFQDFSSVNDNGLSLDINGYAGAAVLNIPLVLVDVYAKGGLMYVDGEFNGQINNQSLSGSEDFIQPFGSIGAELDLGIFNLYTEYTHVIDSDDLEINLLTFGIKLEF